MARRLLDDAPSDADLRRAVSTAYYALVHTVAQAVADMVVPDRSTSLADEAWHVAYRGLDHGALRAACLKPPVIRKLSRPLADFANRIVKMQESRHLADYAPTCPLASHEVHRDIDLSEAATRGFLAAPEPERRAFLAFVLFRGR